MTKEIQEFTKENLNGEVRSMFSRFEKEAKELGIDLTFGRIGFNSDSFHCKLTAKLAGISATSKEITQLKYHGIEIGDTFISNGGQEFCVSGYNSRSYKYPVLAKNSAGQTYKFPVSMFASYS